MSEAWRNGYDSWKLRGPDEDEEVDEDTREEAYWRAYDLAESRMMEDRAEAKWERGRRCS